MADLSVPDYISENAGHYRTQRYILFCMAKFNLQRYNISWPGVHNTVIKIFVTYHNTEMI